MTAGFHEFIQGRSRFQSYLYSYPHKTAYRTFEAPIDLQELWRTEDKSALHLYTHIPFCAQRCAFCNLFALSNPSRDLVDPFLAALEREALAIKDSLGDFHVAGYAIGGGTPSFLDIRSLERLFSILDEHMGIASQACSFEASPESLDADKLRYLADRNIHRLSMGVQSFVASEAAFLGRTPPRIGFGPLLDKIRSMDFPVFNLDLIYGIPGQTASSWTESLERAIACGPEEIFLYPLYIRPLTALFRKRGELDPAVDSRLDLYRIGRGFLLSHGYVQDSLRLFRRPPVEADASEYSCQEDGMVGLGVNARSYTREVHYSTEHAVSRPRIESIIGEYLGRSGRDFSRASHGIRLSLEERRRRFLVKSILKVSGVDRHAYARVFGSEAMHDFPELGSLLEMDLATLEGDKIRLTDEGLSYSDALGHWLISEEVGNAMEGYLGA